MPAILESIPELYAAFAPTVLRSEIPTESKATCGSCAMCPGGATALQRAKGTGSFFRPDTKCCTYHPKLPNYLVGALLADERPELAEGRRRVEEKMLRRVGSTPQWQKAPAKYTLLYNQSRKAFGRSEALLCPYFDKGPGNCTIWPYREAVCSTYFCKYVAGADGHALWMSIKTYLSLLEIQLSRYALYRLFPAYILAGHDRPDGPSLLSPDQLDDGPPPDAQYSALWAEWAGREAELYRACFNIVNTLTPDEVERIVGLDGDLAVAVTAAKYKEAVSAQLPTVLRFDPDATVQWLDDGSIALAAYSEHDGIALPGEAYPLLVAFTGKEPVSVVRARLRATEKADLDDDVLLTLYRHRVLVSEV